MRGVQIDNQVIHLFLIRYYFRRDCNENSLVSSRFPHNFAVVEDVNAYNASVIWITDMDLSEADQGDVLLHGHKFLEMEPSWKTETVTFAKFHSYIVSGLDTTRNTWHASDIIGKGNAFHLDLTKGHPRRINFEQKWVFHMLDHCVSR